MISNASPATESTWCHSALRAQLRWERLAKHWVALQQRAVFLAIQIRAGQAAPNLPLRSPLIAPPRPRGAGSKSNKVPRSDGDAAEK